ncbi:hypothetical protein [Vibrio vulnificus YJ016]|uniref:Uncharacterized protein n=1 Tax=Vibrio vulnificus (strain YJ016) TaxID=196600 RepID=Q7MHC0_VIBVY|nr:hypothetical protein [Vibrio vulnificus YJ016]
MVTASRHYCGRKTNENGKTQSLASKIRRKTDECEVIARKIERPS